MKLSGSQAFTITDGINPPYRMRLVDMGIFEILCVVNTSRRRGNEDMANEVWAWWRRQRIQRTPPPRAA